MRDWLENLISPLTRRGELRSRVASRPRPRSGLRRVKGRLDPQRRRYLVWRLLSVVSAVGAGLTGCESFELRAPQPLLTQRAEPPPDDAAFGPPAALPPSAPAPAVRPVRVLIADAVAQLRIRVDGPFVVTDDAGGELLRGDKLTWTLVRGWNDVVFAGQSLGTSAIRVLPEMAETLWVSTPATEKGAVWGEEHRYAGTLRCVVDERTKLDAINLVEIEPYLAGVVPNECYPGWHEEALRAQAVAARTYVLYEMTRTADAPFDVRATAASQVYGGVFPGQAGRRAAAAVQATRGLVCTWTTPNGERIFPSFFSSSCGGMTQDAANCKPIESIPPLAGGIACDYCQIAGEKGYTWKPVRFSKDELTRLLTRRYPAMASVGRVTRVEVLSQTSAGRPIRLRIVGSKGMSLDLQAEDFRLAVGSNRLKSMACRIVHERDAITFTDGHGYGHAMGLCQWGAQGQALQGRKADEILGYYYPSSNLTRVY